MLQNNIVILFSSPIFPAPYCIYFVAHPSFSYVRSLFPTILSSSLPHILSFFFTSVLTRTFFHHCYDYFHYYHRCLVSPAARLYSHPRRTSLPVDKALFCDRYVAFPSIRFVKCTINYFFHSETDQRTVLENPSRPPGVYIQPRHGGLCQLSWRLKCIYIDGCGRKKSNEKSRPHYLLLQ